MVQGYLRKGEESGKEGQGKLNSKWVFEIEGEEEEGQVKMKELASIVVEAESERFEDNASFVSLLLL